MGADGVSSEMRRRQRHRLGKPRSGRKRVGCGFFFLHLDAQLAPPGSDDVAVLQFRGDDFRIVDERPVIAAQIDQSAERRIDLHHEVHSGRVAIPALQLELTVRGTADQERIVS